MSFVRSFFGGGEEKTTSDATDIVDKLVERLVHSDTLEDRRDALRALRPIAKQMRIHVAKSGLPAFMSIIERESDNTELVAIALDILVTILGDTDEVEDEDDLGERFAESFIEQPNFIRNLISLVEVFDFGVRKALIHLFTSLLRYRGSEVQSAIYKDPMGVVKLADLLQDKREAIRNSAVLMMSELSRANTEIQQLLAYQNVFTVLFDIIGMELYDSIVIEDCLFVILNLLRKNAANQQLFRETGLIQRLAALLTSFLNPPEEENGYEPSDGEWPKQKVANVIFILQVIRSLVSPSDNVQSLIHAAQKAVYATGILGELCKVLVDEKGIAMDVLTETVVAVAEAIRGNYTNQEYFAKTNLIIDGGISRSYLIVLLISMTTEKQPVKLRCAVFYCFICYLHGNSFGKMKIIETVTSGVDSHGDITSGQCLCNAAMSSESLQVWFGSVSLMHCLLEEDDLKNKLLQVQLSVSGEHSRTTLLSHLASQLISYGNRRPQVRAAILMLLSVWVYNCPAAVRELLSREEFVNYLTSQINESGADGTDSENQVVRGLIAFLLGLCIQFQPKENGETKNTLMDLIDRRVGRETFAERLEGVSKSEQYVRAAQKPQPLAKSHSELLLDYQFTKLFKGLEGDMLRMVQPGGDASNPVQNNENIVTSFKELIRKQDEQISALTHQVKKLTGELEKTQPVKEQNRNLEDEVNKLREQLNSKCSMDESVSALTLQLQTATIYGQQWQAEVTKYKEWAEQWQNFQVTQHANPQDGVVQQLTAQINQLEEQLQYGWQAYESQGQQFTSKMNYYVEKIEKLEQELNTAQAAASLTNGGYAENAPVGESAVVETLRREQDELLVLLADQDSKIRDYRKRLLELGDDVTDDDDED
uniref:Uso1_p115_head domain-containing protein n=1 Tax=Steinernema glaseri TaxID=37863 RepID=A0A1I7XYF1_9BILA